MTALPPAGASAADALNCDAVRLFDVTARAARPNFDLAANAQHVVALVRAVAGLPLAILIAAGWLRLIAAVARRGRRCRVGAGWRPRHADRAD